MSWLVYKHVSPSHKVYIGITHLLPSQRWCRGNGYKNNPMFYGKLVSVSRNIGLLKK